MIRTFLIIIILLAEGRQYEIISRTDAMVHAKLANGVDLTVDNRGNPDLLGGRAG